MSDILKRVPVQEQDAKVRATNFNEACLGYTEEDAIEESLRCLECKNPQCVKGCPVSVEIPLFIKQIKQGNFIDAYNVIKRNSSL